MHENLLVQNHNRFKKKSIKYCNFNLKKKQQNITYQLVWCSSVV